MTGLVEERDMPISRSEQQLAKLLADPDFKKAIALVSREVIRNWKYSCSGARSVVLSAVGEPKALDSIHEAWLRARSTGASLGYPMVIIRRRVLDLLAKDARRADHSSLPEVPDGEEDEIVRHDDLGRTAHTILERGQVIDMVQRAVACFGTQGTAQHRQAELLQRRILEDVSYMELSVDLACTQAALRVRLHKAMSALRRHILDCHPELRSLLPSASSWNI
jgi:DNA-directed RNA polymerase specialized sigma24 family protein